ncbi:hypothetical protein [Flavobacterium sp. PL002]|uniref:DUF6933 domain-containing protein n=1 Tax=Flavobacterium sp. PL002 TaxID=1897058 RepID=UPI00178894F4|nr:hypothetical protein [Flavobacterium sp. PL002]MBE0391530.1 hypothetical protein [Flavobacterium sp. PL002]
MINIFCTRKTETFIPVKKKEENDKENDENWICNLISVGGKKSLYFIDKKTLYSILILNVKKKDLVRLESLFMEEFITQLNNDGILNAEKELMIRNKFSEITFYGTDNDQKTLGTLRDNDYHIKRFISDKVDKLHFAKEYMYKNINRRPLGARKFAYAKDLMKSEMENIK